MTKGRSKLAKYSRWPIAIALMLLVGCSQKSFDAQQRLDPQAVEPPRPVQTHGPIADSYFQITIDYEYKQVAYHGTWIGHCFLYQNGQGGFNAKARWRGYSARLPDGSAVFFQPRAEICAKNQLRRLLFGPDAPDTLWDGRQLYPTFPPEMKLENDLGDSDPTIFTTPAVYWLDSPTQPIHVELCGLPACALADNARVKILGIHAGPTQSTAVSNPLQAIPALAQLRSGDLRHIGYACWKIPLPELNKIAGSYSGNFVPGHIDGNRVRYILELLNSIGYRTMNSWSYSWEETQLFDAEYHPIEDVGFAAPMNRDYVSVPITRWRKSCQLVGSKLIFEDKIAPPNLPININVVRLEDASQISLLIPEVNNYSTFRLGPDQISFDPDRYLVSATDSDNSLYIGEPIEFAFDFYHGEAQ